MYIVMLFEILWYLLSTIKLCNEHTELSDFPVSSVKSIFLGDYNEQFGIF
jgi:hypothetical protein